jgi:dihydrofolate reductase
MSTMGFSSQLTKLDKWFGQEQASSARGSRMRELTADLFVSLDGFAAGKNVGPFFGLGGPDLDTWVKEELNKPQLMLMGRVTFEAMAGMSSSATDELSVRLTDLPKVVVSNTLKEPLAWKNSRLIKGPHAIAALKQQPGEPVRSIGSVSLVKSLMQTGQVDRLRLMVFPIVLGSDGQQPAFAGYLRTRLELAATKVLDSRLLLLEYRLSPVSQPEASRG